MALKLLPPIQTSGKITIPVINKKIPKMLALVGFGAGLIGLYFVMKKRGMGPGNLRTVNIAPDVDFVVVPNEVRPDSFITVSGTFMDEKKRPVITKGQARYLVYEDATTQGSELVSSGLIGTNISTFSIRIPTTSFKQSQYSIRITDDAVTQEEIGQKLSTGPPAVGGSGATGIQRNQSAISTPGFGISVS